jgi:hypothetical protein
MQLDAHELDAGFPDGWLAVVRLEPYRVDWRKPDGTWVNGKPLPFSPVQVTDGEKKLTMVRLAEVAGLSSPRDPAEFDWPALVPPFERGGRALADSRGNVVIERVPTVANPQPSYDVVNREGKLVASVLVERNTRIVGFGRSAVYVAEIDTNGVQWVRKHDWRLSAVR